MCGYQSHGNCIFMKNSYRKIIDRRLDEKERNRKALRHIAQLFVVSSSLIFATFLVVFFAFRLPNLKTPFSFQCNTVIIALSSIALFYCVRALKEGAQKRAYRWLLIGIALGMCFALVQILGWKDFMQNNLNFRNILLPMVAAHFAHVVVALLLLISAASQVSKYRIHGRQRSFLVNTVWFWHFLGFIWMVFITIT